MTPSYFVNFFLPGVYGCVSMILYLWVVIALIVNRKTLKSSFYRLFVVGFVMNLLTYTNSFASLRLPRNTGINDTMALFFLSHSMENEASKCPINVFHTLHYEFAYAQYIFNCFICLNRFTMIYFPFQSEIKWKRHVWKFVIFIFVAPAPATGFILFNRSFYRYSQTADYFWIDTTLGRGNIYIVLTPVLSVITVVNIFLNLSTYHKMRKIKKEGIDVPEKSLLRMSFCVFTIDMFLTVLAIINAVLIISNPQRVRLSPLASWVSKLTPFASDMLTLSPPYLLLGFSKMVRRKCIELVPVLRDFRVHPYFANSKSAVAHVVRRSEDDSSIY